ncbi:MAG: putative endonuclease 4 [Phycisphaerae bacterium]
MFGSHLSIAGGMVNALTEAERLGLDTVQVFTKNQRQWKTAPLDRASIESWKKEVDRLGWGGRTVSHASYLINLASADDDLWEKSVSLMREEIERCEALGIPFLVHHPGSSVRTTREKGLERIAAAYARLFRETAGYRTISCLEGTVGAGSTLGGTFEELAELRAMIIDRTGQERRVGYCLDSCHLHAAGYDMASRAAAAAVLDRFDATCGLGYLKVLHLNDSKGKLASRLDRHEHIGEGWVGGGASSHTGKGTFSPDALLRSGFAALVNHPILASIPKILETPKEKNAQGIDMDVINVARLRSVLDSAPPDVQPRRLATSPALSTATPAKAAARRGVTRPTKDKKAAPRRKSR